MSVRSSKCSPKTSMATPSFTSSPESGCGATPCERQDGTTAVQCGPALAPASPSPAPASAKEPATTDTCGRTCSDSSASTDLTSALVSRLQALTACSGSTLYKLIWKERATPSGRSIPALRASVRRISDSDSTGWPTPRSSDTVNTNETPEQWSVRQDAMKAKNPKLGGLHKPLGIVAKMTGWPTPAQTDYKGGYQGGRIRNGEISTDRLDVTAQISGPARRTASGEVLTGSGAKTGDGAQLNPALSRWLMGLPAEWDACAPTATRSSRRKPKPS